jgi:c-di-GMP-binding flagellar brake protein YcgR
MFEVGKVYKVKVEVVPGQVGFGRATVVERKGNQLTVQVRTAKDLNATFPKGTRLWFVSDSSETFSGLWATAVTDTLQSNNKSLMVVSPPKLEPLYQRRRTPRVTLEVPVEVWLNDGESVADVYTKDISRSGVAVETPSTVPDTLDSGDQVKMKIQSSVGDIEVAARIIRIENNWLANKTVVGLEFVDLPKQSVELLDKLLVLFGGKPRNPEAGAESKQESGLASWISSPAEVRGRFVGTQSEQAEQVSDEDAID